MVNNNNNSNVMEERIEEIGGMIAASIVHTNVKAGKNNIISVSINIHEYERS